MDTCPQPEGTWNLKGGGSLDQIDRDHRSKFLGHPAKGCWTQPRHFKVILKGLVQEEGIGHELPLELTPKAAGEVALGVEAGVTAGLIARVVLGVAFRVDDKVP